MFAGEAEMWRQFAGKLKLILGLRISALPRDRRQTSVSLLLADHRQRTNCRRAATTTSTKQV